MQRLQAYKYELMPDGEQERHMRRFAGSCRFVYNKALAMQKENHEAGNKFIGYVAMAKHLTGWRNGSDTPWLRDAPCHPLQHALKDLETAYKNFFDKRADFPKLKRKGSGDTFRYPDPKQIKLDQGNDRIFLPKLGWLRYRNSRDVMGEVRNATVSQSGGKWFASIQTQREVEQPLPTATSAIGIDVGIARFATMSDESYIAPLNSFKKHQQRLARYQRRMSRKVKFSSNWKKAKAKVQQIHTGIANARKDFLHKTTTTISQNHALVCIEDLQVRNMSKSSKGNSEQPGKKVAQKSGLNRSILDQGWGEFRRQLAYKVQWHGGMLMAVPPHHTSQTCPACAHVSKDNRQTQAKFLCVDCGYENHADVVGAINVLARGHRVLACGETAQSGRSVKQEPTEATRKSSRSAVGIPVL
ncbi:transposase [Undibacterium sp. RTI2.1]|uniref:RNA-guided endonuclease InsQ/TnpB family protein n=1 Tax=unclassified Undibacterium TaxID=2630295 RepID=UPI002AB4F6B5|nr:MULTISPECIES: transposase [unclassified Undibacterium]MDY7539897.1 transposase [Undibacterium sp. 5I1]MEB0031192.1 transposase [Undibacterium sp. RTI2.1]MEB0116408.1 transposase [Undibacterium sp. RTI2.2]MEB0230504.1 transposase [Undibacterium sp. 10I3]MEB0257202.1 transposase [Undibacterium sp. 5I1]